MYLQYRIQTNKHERICLGHVETVSFQALAGIGKISLWSSGLYFFPCITSQFAFKRRVLLPKILQLYRELYWLLFGTRAAPEALEAITQIFGPLNNLITNHW